MQECNFQHGAMSMLTSQISNFVDFPKTPKSRYLENETLFFSSVKKIH